MGCKVCPIEQIRIVAEMYPQYCFKNSVYTKTKQPIDVYCPKHDLTFSYRYNDIRNKKGLECPKCKEERERKHAIEMILSVLPNYTFDDDFVYNGWYNEVILICPNGHKFSKKYRYLVNGLGCNECGDLQKIKKNKKYTSVEEHIRNIENRFESIKFKEIPKGNHIKVEVECSIHGVFKSTIHIMEHNKHPCKICSRINEKYLEEMIQSSPLYDFSMFKYINHYTKSIVRCSQGHSFNYSYSQYSHNKIVLCPYCHPHIASIPEAYLIDHIKRTHSLNPTKNRSIIKSKVHRNRFLEIDIFLEDLSIGFEYNGGYYHTNIKFEQKGERYKLAYGDIDGYHQHKFDECKKAGIDLYFIEEKDYKKDKQAVLDRIDAIITTRVAELNNQEPKCLATNT